MPQLYVVSTPIGNLEDITLRALRVLGEVGLVAAEDTRKTKAMLRHYKIPTPVTSYHDHNEKAKLPLLLGKLEEVDIALVSEAGTPVLNDPGYTLILACIERAIPVVPIPGASSITSALVVSGMSTNSFVFLGFVPRKLGARKELLSELNTEKRTLVFLESPHRLLETLNDINAILPQRHLALCRELTKLHEEVFRGTAAEALAHFQNPRGEFVIVIEGARSEELAPHPDESILLRLEDLTRAGKSAKDAVAEVARALRLPKRHVYQLWHKQP